MTSAEVQDRITHPFLVERVLTGMGWVVLGIGAVSRQASPRCGSKHR